MIKALAKSVPRVNALVNRFLPVNIRQSRDGLQAVRMFLFSHLFGPLLGHTISLAMLYVGAAADLSWWILFACISAFWFYPVVLRITGWYVPLALLSIQNLLFCIFWGCYNYGGVSSPIMPWLVAVPLLAIFYLPERTTRVAVVGLVGLNLSVFYFVYSTIGFKQSVPAEGLVVLGLVSTFCASAYVSMMAMFFASTVYSQGELEQELERHRATERKLREATNQAQRALMAKSSFLAKMSHELKNPLNAVIGYSELLIEDAGVAATQKRTDLESIKRAGYRLLALINDLLELSRLEAGRMELRLSEFKIAEMLEDAVSRARAEAVAFGNELLVQAPVAGWIVGDVHKLRRVIEGLLSNATSFTRDGRIVVSAWLCDDSWVVTVADTGVGIPKARMATLFETFGRSEEETASKYNDEVRLGLPLAYRYCKLMGGDLSVVSEPGLGCTVTITLPNQPLSVPEPTLGSAQIQAQAA